MDAEGVAAAARLPVRGLPPRGVHLPVQMAAWLAGDVGQSLRLALRAERLSRAASAYAARDREWRQGAVNIKL